MLDRKLSAPLAPPRALVDLAGALSGARAWAIVICVLSLLIRAVYALLAPRIDPFLLQDPLLGDAASYDRIARTLMEHGVYGMGPDEPIAFWPPLYPMLLAGIYSAFGHNLLVARLIQAALGAVLPLAVLFVARDLAGMRVARVASLGAALYPFLIYFGAWLIAEALFFALLGLLLLAGVSLQRAPGVARAALFGCLTGIAALAKPTILMLLPFLVIWFLGCLTRVGLPRRFLLGVVTAVVVLATLLPWTMRNFALLGHVVLISTNGGYTFYGANNPDAFGGHYEHFPPRVKGLNEAEEQALFYRLGSAWIYENPAPFARVTGQKLVRLLSPLSVASSPEDLRVPGAQALYALYSLFLLTALAGLVLSLRRWREYYLLYACILCVLLSTVMFYGDTRYTLPAVPSLVIFAALALTTLGERWLGRR